MHELNIAELAPDDIVRLLNRAFLKAQSDNWIRKLYEFLNGQRDLRQRWWFDNLPLIRLEDGSHVAVEANGKRKAFLPTETATGFPTVRGAVCSTEPALAFL